MKSERQEKRKKGGLVFIISAPSGAGKTTLVKRVMEALPGLRFSVSYTTRPPRNNEREGEDYHFVPSSTFRKMVENDQFLEWAEVLGNLYGTARMGTDLPESAGVDLILDIDTQGARKVLKKIADPVLIFILPPSLEELRRRLVKRGLDSPEMIQFRLAGARKEIEESGWYHYVIVNDRMKDAAETLKAIIIAERCRREKKMVLEEKRKEWEEDHGKNHG